MPKTDERSNALNPCYNPVILVALAEMNEHKAIAETFMYGFVKVMIDHLAAYVRYGILPSVVWRLFSVVQLPNHSIPYDEQN